MMALAQETIQEEKRYFTYSDYVKWDDGERYELINGVAFAMSAPSWAHQAILLKLGRRIGNFLEGKKCRVFIAPLDVRLNANKKDDIVLQPDLLVVCDESKLSEGKSCKGTPDMVIEILSFSTAKYDRVTKLKLYKAAKVKEIWIVDPMHHSVEVHLLEEAEDAEGVAGAEYTMYIYRESGAVLVKTLPNLQIEIEDIFESVADEKYL